MIKFHLKLLTSLVLLSNFPSSTIESLNLVQNSKKEIFQEKSSLFNKLKENSHLKVDQQIKLYYKLKKEEFDSYNFENDRELNQYGYFLLEQKKTEDALEIFKLLVSEFPENSNAYDSLGEAYLILGKEELSIENYEISVRLNPKNYHGIDQITKLKGLELLLTDWGKEIFHFPIHFAPEIKYEGVEEVVFPKNWIHIDSSDFWSYVFVWALDNKKEMSPAELEISLRHYFDGLAEVVNDDKELELMKTKARFQLNQNPKDSVHIIGEITIYDAFASHKALKLNARVFSNYCEEKESLILLFQFSPKPLEHDVWDKLRTVKLRSSICWK